MTRLTLDPITRVEGHLRIDTEVGDGTVAAAWSRGEMFRGFERLLAGRDPFDAPVITQRICGVCPVSHAVASCRALEDALAIRTPRNGRLLRNLVLGANYLQSHVLHFYHLAALDFVDVEALLGYSGRDPVLRELQAWARSELASNRVLPAAPLLPRLPGDYPTDPAWNLGALAHYVEALEVRTEAHALAALFGGKMPHTASLVPGGVTTGVDPEAVETARAHLHRLRRFIDHVYLPDVATLARTVPEYAALGRSGSRFLSYGVFEEDDGSWLPAGTVAEGRPEPLHSDRIGEETGASRYRSAPARHPSRGVTDPDPERDGAYSWIKAPRYDGSPCEVGPLARMLVAAAGSERIRGDLAAFATEAGLDPADLEGMLGRHAARAFEAHLLAQRMETWLDRLDPSRPTVAPGRPPRQEGSGEGLTEAPRGALGHWVRVEANRIHSYQCLVPSTWNFSPRDDRGTPGPVEAALVGTPVDPGYGGLEVARVVRSFDPCIACAVH